MAELNSMAKSNALRPPLVPRSKADLVTQWLSDWALALPLIALIVVMLGVPTILTAYQSFIGKSGDFSLENWAALFSSRSAKRAIGNSLMLAATVATIALVVGAPLAWFAARASARLRSVQLGILNVAAHFSGTSLGFAYVAALGSYGLVTLSIRKLGIEIDPPASSSFWGMVIAYEYISVPMFVILSLPVMGLIRTEYWEAAQTSAASRWQFWRYVGLPILTPFLLATWLLIFTWSIGMYSLPIALSGAANSYPMITTEMGRSLLGSFFGANLMPAYSTLLMGMAIISLIAYRLIIKRASRWLS